MSQRKEEQCEPVHLAAGAAIVSRGTVGGFGQAT